MYNDVCMNKEIEQKHDNVVNLSSYPLSDRETNILSWDEDQCVDTVVDTDTVASSSGNRCPGHC